MLFRSSGNLVTITTNSDLKEGDRVQVGAVDATSNSTNSNQQRSPEGMPGDGPGGGMPFGGG